MKFTSSKSAHNNQKFKKINTINPTPTNKNQKLKNRIDNRQTHTSGITVFDLEQIQSSGGRD